MNDLNLESLILSQSLTPTEKMICWFIKTAGRQDLTNNEIAEKIGRDLLTVSRAISSLTKKEVLLTNIQVTKNGTEREVRLNPNFSK